MRLDFCKTDPLLHAKTKKLSASSKNNYNNVFNEIYNLTGKTPTQLVKIGFEEQDAHKQETFEYLPFRTITKIQTQYETYLDSKNITESTKETKMRHFRALFNKNKIILPDFPKFVVKKHRIRQSDLPQLEDLALALEISNSPLHQLVFISSFATGLRLSDLANLKIKDILEGAKLYTNGSIYDLMKLDPFTDNIIIRLEVNPIKTESTGNLCITFTTPEWTFYLFNYLKWRINEYNKNKKEYDKIKDKKGYVTLKKDLKRRMEKYSLKPEAYLFVGSKTRNKMDKNTMVTFFNRMNKKIKEYRDIEKKEYDHLDYNKKYGKFRSHNFRKIFRTTCRKNIIKINLVKNNNKPSVFDYVALFTGHIPESGDISEIYDAIDDDSWDSDLRTIYTQLVPYLSLDSSRYELQEKKEEVDKLNEKNIKLNVENKLLVSELKKMKEKTENTDKRLDQIERTILTNITPSKIEKIRKIM